ncbi:MAG TPA: gluconate 2-dehydrogenase subunit 3 family protein [Chryseolinea sp.]
MNRRDAIARVGLLVGGTVIGAESFLSGCTKRSSDKVSRILFSNEIVSLMDEVGETILPTTASAPGAKAARIGEFMKTIVLDCYEEKDQVIFINGAGLVQQNAQLKYGKTFHALDEKEKYQLISSLDTEAKEHKQKIKKEDDVHYFTMIKQLTLWGYFTSQIGSENALRYLPVPGKFVGCVDYTKGDRAWSEI